MQSLVSGSFLAMSVWPADDHNDLIAVEGVAEPESVATWINNYFGFKYKLLGYEVHIPRLPAISTKIMDSLFTPGASASVRKNTL